MNSWVTVNALRDERLKQRRQRIRHTTYDYVTSLMLEDTAPENPFRVPMVLDWWSRVVQPLRAETHDKERLRYFRELLKGHQRSAAANAAIRQGLSKDKPVRRLSVRELTYMRHQVRRMADRSLNYAAAERALAQSDLAFEQLLFGLIALPRLSPSRNGFLYGTVFRINQDERSEALFQKAVAGGQALFPAHSQTALARRIGQIRNPFDQVWLFDGDDYVEDKKEAALIRMLEDEYRSYIK